LLRRREQITQELELLNKLEEIHYSQIEQLGSHTYIPELDPSKMRDYTMEDIFESRKNDRKGCQEECTNFNELSSIYENTEEEMCTPERNYKIDYCTLDKPKQKKIQKDNYGTNRSNSKNTKNFFKRMQNDVKERNEREHDFREMFRGPIKPALHERKISKKRTKSIIDRLHTLAKPCSMDRTPNSKSV
jgi:hypothetical protein